ncbi:MAG TPA: S-layer homology domain-containing protein, partial [Chloroflexia bacterium]|nr:S-layer homology domain-containing protein [Chloroflexia bacterium]
TSTPGNDATRTAVELPTSTATSPATATRVAGPSPTATRALPTSTATRPATSTPVPTATPCTLSFTDVPPTAYYRSAVLYLACHGVISGYSNGDGTVSFRPYNNTTRGQMVKIVVLGFRLAVPTPPAGRYSFADVPPSHPFYTVVESAVTTGIVSGYACGGPNEPCDSATRPYFRPNNYVTRGQLAKIIVSGAQYALRVPPLGSFADVLPGSPFYAFVETAACHALISGYTCGGRNEPCDTTGRPYFRPGAQATRGQIAKIQYGALTSTQICAATGTR